MFDDATESDGMQYNAMRFISIATNGKKINKKKEPGDKNTQDGVEKQEVSLGLM